MYGMEKTYTAATAQTYAHYIRCKKSNPTFTYPSINALFIIYNILKRTVVYVLIEYVELTTCAQVNNSKSEKVEKNAFELMKII